MQRPSDLNSGSLQVERSLRRVLSPQLFADGVLPEKEYEYCRF